MTEHVQRMPIPRSASYYFDVEKGKHAHRKCNLKSMLIGAFLVCLTAGLSVGLMTVLLKGGHINIPCQSCVTALNNEHHKQEDLELPRTESLQIKMQHNGNKNSSKIQGAANLFLSVKSLQRRQLMWTAQDFPEAVLTDDIKMTKSFDGTYGCLKVTTYGLYFFNSQITFKYNKSAIVLGNRFYHTVQLCKRDSLRCDVFSKATESVPRQELRERWNWKQSLVTGEMVLDFGDEVCANVADIHLVYQSAKDSFFSLVRL